jgi:hypothetical protein
MSGIEIKRDGIRPGRESLRVTWSMADTRNCEQCGTSFAPRREHARFCSARCRVTWNRHNASDSPAATGPLDWSITAMRETTDRLMRAGGLDQANGFAVIGEAVWWVTMVDATLMRYHPDAYSAVLARQNDAERPITEDTFGGLRFVRNRMGYDTDPAEFIQPLDTGPSAGRIGAWTWRSLPEPAPTSLTGRAREWEMTRYRAYQAQLAARPIGETFSRATAFLRLAVEGSSLSHT